MAPSIKLTYFDVQGLGEVVRMLLKYGDIEFEDVRVSKEKWPELKASTPFGQLPVYEENGKTSGQSLAISRYVAKKVNLVGDNDWENLEIDAVVDTISDFRAKMSAVFLESDPERKKKLQETQKETSAFYFGRLDKLIEKNNGYLAAGKLTWADIYLFSLFDSVKMLIGDEIDNYPNLVALREKIGAIPNIKAWLEISPRHTH